MNWRAHIAIEETAAMTQNPGSLKRPRSSSALGDTQAIDILGLAKQSSGYFCSEKG